ncbi:phage Gp37/Gp68 family protein [uncultured Bacteroides sp.]|uniref:phage Gp37/Gp68 family protein n=1 Tax=uncultured Bacteroides sp. TaxID=162156 RepID=UPI002AAB7DED|nr:phage Gp37/Gp68 family protein [uncultured Bacteroides sp.]
MKTTRIEWTDKTWNPITGCTKVSAGCFNCYAEVMSRRLKAMGQAKYRDGFKLSLHEENLQEPLRWKSPHTIFVCSMSDLFHEDVPFSFIDEIMKTINVTPWHRYQLLTKRAKRMTEYFQTHEIPQNAWLGVTVEAKSSKNRIDLLRNLEAPIRFLSCEPLLEDLEDLNLANIDWVIVGGESGTKARPMKEEWALLIKKQAEEQGAAFFFKQWGTWGSDGVKRNKHVNGKMIDGKIYQEIPGK